MLLSALRLLIFCTATAIRELCNERDTCNISDVHIQETKHIIDRLCID